MASHEPPSPADCIRYVGPLRKSPRRTLSLARACRVCVADTYRLEAIEPERHRHRAFADDRYHTFDQSAADIADAEDPGPDRLEQQWRELHALELSHLNMGSRQHEAVIVQSKLSVEPLGARRGADKDE